MRFHLRTLLIVLALLPPAIFAMWLYTGAVIGPLVLSLFFALVLYGAYCLVQATFYFTIVAFFGSRDALHWLLGWEAYRWRQRTDFIKFAEQYRHRPIPPEKREECPPPHWQNSA